jgi:hypothetical protein
MRQVVGIAIAVVTALMVASCSPDPYANLNAPGDFFARGKIGTSPDYAVIKFGNAQDHVITVHGFSDDEASCREVADALNFNACKETDGTGCLNPYSCRVLNK